MVAINDGISLPDEIDGYRFLQVYEREEPRLFTADTMTHISDMLAEYYGRLRVKYRLKRSVFGLMIPEITDTKEQRVVGAGSVFVIPDDRTARFEGFSGDYPLLLDEPHLKEFRNKFHKDWNFIKMSSERSYVPLD